MDINEKDAVNDVLNILVVEPASDSEPLTRLRSGYHRKKLAVLVVSGKEREMISVSFTQDQIKKLPEQDVEKYIKRYETS